MQNSAQKRARQFMTEHNLQKVDLQTMKEILTKQGYTLVEYNRLVNDKDVSAIVKALGLEKLIELGRGFTYVDQHRRLVFLNEELSEDEKLLVLVHEEGHIYCNHITATSIIGTEVSQEYEANEFTHYVLNRSVGRKLCGFMDRNKAVLRRVALIAGALAIVVAILFAVMKERSYFGELYLTNSGNKYHKKECIFVKDKNNSRRMTIEEFESGKYEPCGICLPE